MFSPTTPREQSSPTSRDRRKRAQPADIGLPGMDGYDFIRALRKIEGEGTRIPAIALTGYAGAIDESNALNAGYELHFSKPINLSELAQSIAKLSGKK